MKKRTRFIILLACIALFLSISPLIVFYSMGYRFDVATWKVMKTGGIYVRTFPAADQVIFDTENVQSPGFFNNAVFVQNLLPQMHTIAIRKDGYHDYNKTLPVEEKEVTKLENVQLFKKDMVFTELQTAFPKKPVERFALKSGSLYYAEIPENADVPSPAKRTYLIKNVAGFTASGNSIFWISPAGLVFRSDINPATGVAGSAVPLSTQALSGKGPYTLFIKNAYVFISANGSLMQLHNGTFIPVAEGVKTATFSPDGNTLAYATAGGLFVLDLIDPDQQKNRLYAATAPVTDVQWMNNYYLVFVTGNSIIISETDARGQVNTVTFPSKLSLSNGETLPLTAPLISFDGGNNTLLIQTNKTVIQSEKLL